MALCIGATIAIIVVATAVIAGDNTSSAPTMPSVEGLQQQFNCDNRPLPPPMYKIVNKKQVFNPAYQEWAKKDYACDQEKRNFHGSI
jgi:hypothetical protein